MDDSPWEDYDLATNLSVSSGIAETTVSIHNIDKSVSGHTATFDVEFEPELEVDTTLTVDVNNKLLLDNGFRITLVGEPIEVNVTAKKFEPLSIVGSNKILTSNNAKTSFALS